ncbi:MAG: hypothetical protein VCD00_00900 [Candidatus Hydrogenedentota bacterium]
MREFTALIYEQWRSMRFLFGMATAMSIIGCFFATLDIILTGEEQTEWVAGWFVFGQCMWILFLLTGSGNNDELTLTVPRYLTKLPVSASKLVAARLSFAILSHAALLLLFAVLYYLLFNEALGFWSVKGTLLLVAAYAIFQSIFWAFGPTGYILPLSISATPLVLFLGLTTLDLDTTFAAWALFASPLSIPVSIFAVSRHRLIHYETFADLFDLQRQKKTVESTLIESDTFASQEEALRWYEYRRHWQLYPRILLICFVALVLIILGTTVFDEIFGAGIASLAFIVLIALLNGTLLTFCIFLFRSKRYLTNRVCAFVYIRPASTLDLAASQWRASADAMLVGLLPAAAVVLFLFADGAVKAESDMIPRLALASAAIIFFMVMTLWASLWPVVSVGAFGVMMTALLLMRPWIASDWSETDYILFSFPAASVIAGGLLAFLFIWNWRNKLLNAKHVLFPLTLIALAILGHQLIQEYDPGDYSWIPFWTILIIAPILTTPAIIHRTRHRR